MPPLLLPPEAFTTRCGASREPLGRIKQIFASRTSGMDPAPNAEDFIRALRKAALHRTLTPPERQAVELWLSETTTAQMIDSWLDGAYSLRTLVSAMHAVTGAAAHGTARTRALNTHCEASWIRKRNATDPLASMKSLPPERF